MEISRDLLLILHFIAMAGLLGGLLASQSKLNKGVLHSSLLALVTGLGLVGIRYSLVDSYPDQYEEINHSVVGIKKAKIKISITSPSLDFLIPF